jgi:aminoglycoside phosphotransferase (APT) family kinase protein
MSRREDRKVELAEQLIRYMNAHPFDAGLSCESVDGLKSFPVGAAQETWRFTGHFTDNRGVKAKRGLVLRREMENSIIETSRTLEFAAYQSFHGSAVPVPEPIALIEDRGWFGSPAMLMEEVPGCESAPMALTAPPYNAHLKMLGEAKWRMLADIANTDPGSTPLGQMLPLPPPQDCWHIALDQWTEKLAKDQSETEPAVDAAIRWLRRNPPAPPETIRIVHGDFRTGNFLFDEQGQIRALLDWEMCHLGDPLEDFAWACGWMWSGGHDDQPGRLISLYAAREIYRRETGHAIQARDLLWWRLFSTIKGMAIWVSSAQRAQSGVNDDPLMVMIGWFAIDKQRREIIHLMQQAREAAQ